jgi:predicted small secreted protein
MKTRLFKAGCLIVSALVLMACNTVAGIGKDVERAGEKVQEVAKRK